MLMALAMGFIVLEALAALYLAVTSAHGPSGLAWAAAGYLVVAAVLTWGLTRWAQVLPRPAGIGVVLLGGLGLLALAPGLLYAMDRLELRALERRVAATVVRDVRDEPILGRGGRSVGIRLTLIVAVPDSRAYAIWPNIRSADDRFFRFPLSPARAQADGWLFVGELAAGPHELVFDCYPTPVWCDQAGQLRLSPAPPPELSPADPVAPLRVEIAETPYGAPWRGGQVETTRGAYSIVELYRAALDEFR